MINGLGAALVRYDTMCRAIDAAYEVDEVKGIRDRAAALEHYSRQAHNVEAERQCCEIRLRAERKWRQLYDAGEKAKRGPDERGQGSQRTTSETRTLSELGVTKDQAADWAKLAALSNQQFEAALARPDKPTTNGIINAAFPPKPKPVSADALWLWGRLEEFKRQALHRDPAEFLETLTPQMLGDVRALLPKVVNWLTQLGKEIDG